MLFFAWGFVNIEGWLAMVSSGSPVVKTSSENDDYRIPHIRAALEVQDCRRREVISLVVLRYLPY